MLQEIEQIIRDPNLTDLEKVGAIKWAIKRGESAPTEQMEPWKGWKSNISSNVTKPPFAVLCDDTAVAPYFVWYSRAHSVFFPACSD